MNAFIKQKNPEYNRRCKKTYGILFLLLVTLLFSCFTIDSEASQTRERSIASGRELRVAFYPLEGFFEYDEAGNEIGYGVELLDKLSTYTGYHFTYVKADSWESTKQMLLDGEADIRMPGTLPIVPSTTLSYNSTSIIDTYHVILALNSRDDLYYDDYDTIRTLKIAISQGFYEATNVVNYLDRIGITPDQLVFCDTYLECRELLVQEKVDALVSNIMDKEDNMKMLARFNTTSNYISMTLDNPDLEYLQDAITQLKLDEPLFLSNLYEKWFPERTVVPFTIEESAYLQNKEILTFAFRSDEGYLQRYEDGEFYGIYVEQAKAICEKLGIEFCAVSMEDYFDGKAEADILAGFYYDKNYSEEWGFEISDPVDDINYYVIQKKNATIEDATCRVAAVQKFKYTSEYLEQKYRSNQIQYYESYEECLQAVEKGKADIVVMNNYIAEYYLEQYQFSDLVARLTTEYSHLYCFAVGDGNAILASIISKTLSSIPEDEMRKVYIRGLEKKPDNNYLLAMIYHSPMQFAMLVAFLSTIVIVFLMLLIFIGRRNKQNRVLSAALSVKSDFLARMSHDMRTPLNAVLGFTSIARDEGNDPSVVQDCLTKIKSSGEYLLGLINDILDASKLENGKIELHPEIVEGNAFLHEIAEEFRTQAATRGITLITDLENANTPYVKMDKIRTRQIYSNLLNNALKFSDSGSTVRWYMKDTMVDKTHMRFITTISDEGCGMSPEFMKHIYEPFSQEYDATQKEREGTGLGLMIVKRLVELSGGTISVESKAGEGTTFTLHMKRELPTEEEIQKYCADKKDKEQDYSILNGVKVLLCEDHPINREIATRLLSKYGVVTECAENGQIGVDIFAEKPEDYYGAILMDIRMPVMGGIEAAKAIRSMNSSIPIIATTANAYPEDIKESLDAGMNAHLSKPLEPQKLYEILIQSIEKRKRGL